MILYADEDTRKKSVLFTPFSLIHVISGITGILILYYINNNDSEFVLFNKGIIFHILYELKDYYYSYVLNYNTKLRNNSIINSYGDIIMGALGQIIALFIIRYNKNITSCLKITIIFQILSHILFRSNNLD